MKNKLHKTEASLSEMTILSDGRIMVQNLTKDLAKLLSELNPADELMRRRAQAGSRRNSH